MSSPQAEGPYGFLRTCIDKRFVEATRRAFEERVRRDLNLTPEQFGPTSYWHEAYAGGSAKAPPGFPDGTSDGETYAAKHGAIVFGWQAHISNCGGFPEPPPPQDPVIIAGLRATFEQKQKDHPTAIFQYMILARETEPGKVDIHFTPYPPDAEEPSI
ncbi:MAG TPA: hypothetical protein VKT82_19515 [Ktedonobacterales bacterium]|nr:hypothetical protein [Ktedonobacterales bacterium]